MEQPIRVLCVFSKLDRGGAESMCMNLYRTIDRSKVQFDFVKHTSEIGQFEDEITRLGGKIYEAPIYKIINHKSYCRWWRNHFKTHPEHIIVHGHYYTISAVYFSIAKKCHRITIGHSHCTETPRSLYRNIVKSYIAPYYLKRVEKYSDYCFACSKEAGEWLFPSKEYRVLNNAIDANLYRANDRVGSEVRDEFGLADSLVVGAVGRFDKQKNPFGIIEIFNKVHNLRKNSLLLWIGDGSLRQDVENTIRDYKLQNAVILTGVRNDVARLMQAMDAFILPSFYEGLGIVSIEAQAAGVETFCSTGVPRESGITTLCHFLPLDNLNSWCKEISYLPAKTYHPDMLEKVVNAGYDIHTTAKWLQDFYISIS